MSAVLLTYLIQSNVIAILFWLALRRAGCGSPTSRSALARGAVILSVCLPGIAISVAASVDAAAISLDVLSDPSANPGDHSTGNVLANAVGSMYALEALLLIYTLVCTILVVRLLLGVRALAELRCESAPVRAPELVALLADCKRRLGFDRPVDLRVCDSLSSPCCWQLREAVIVIDSRTARSPKLAEFALLHELGHLERHDWRWQLALKLLTSFNWLNVPLWMLARIASENDESAADRRAVDGGLNPVECASLLLDFSQSCRDLPVQATAASGRARRMSARIRTMLSMATAEAPEARRRVRTAGVAYAALVPLALFIVIEAPASAVADSEIVRVSLAGTGLNVVVPAGITVREVGGGFNCGGHATRASRCSAQLGKASILLRVDAQTPELAWSGCDRVEDAVCFLSRPPVE